MKKKVRKTIDVKEFKDSINKILALPIEKVSEEEKKGLCSALEMVLFDTGNYHGYNNVDWLNGGWQKWKEDGMPDFPEKAKYIGRDYSRMYY